MRRLPGSRRPGGAGRRKAEIEKVVKDYLLANPEILVQAQQALEAKMEKDQAEKTKAALKDHATDIFKDPDAAVAAIRTATSRSSNSSTTTAAIAGAATTTSPR